MADAEEPKPPARRRRATPKAAPSEPGAPTRRAPARRRPPVAPPGESTEPAHSVPLARNRPPAVPESVALAQKRRIERRAAGDSGFYDRARRTGLLSAGAIARREVGAYFVSPVGYVVGAILAVLVAWSGYLPYLSAQEPIGMDQVYYWTIFWMMIGVPIITMRLLAEERRMGTLEMLLTSPVRDWEVVVGKWIGAVVFFIAVTGFVFVIAALLIYYQPTHQVLSVAGLPLSVGNLDLGPVFTGYLGLVLAGGAFLAVGELCSSFTANPVIAAFAGIATLAILFFLLGFFVGQPPYGDIVNYLWAYNHWTSFTQGRLAVQDVVYYATMILGALFLTTRVLESRRWL
jgi:ABC-2 type transport system permease protein